MTYESVRKYLTPDGDKNPSPYRKLLAGAVSGAVAQTCTYPLLVMVPFCPHVVARKLIYE
jgi:solute carrier family 25 phosphate transporter 23/24/25/41